MRISSAFCPLPPALCPLPPAPQPETPTMLKRNKLLILAIAGSSVFSGYSNLDNHFLISSLVILPFQVGTSLYLIYLYWSGQLKGSFRYQKQQQDHES